MHFKDYKTILSPHNNMNLFRGCTHGCIYCDSRSKCYQINHAFEDIEIKSNAVAILERQLQKKRQKAIISTGSMCDPYIMLENELKITQQSLKLIERYGFGVCIQTKSNRILRDLDILKKINEKTKCVVAITLTTFDDNLCKKIEPNVSTTSERFETLKILRDNGIPTIVWICPILPFINDTEENLRGLLDYCFEAKVKGIINFGFSVTLREGDREYFYENIDKHFPGMKQKYMKTFGNSYVCISPNNNKLMAIFNEECKKHSVMHQPKTIFDFIYQFPIQESQMSIFDF